MNVDNQSNIGNVNININIVENPNSIPEENNSKNENDLNRIKTTKTIRNTQYDYLNDEDDDLSCCGKCCFYSCCCCLCCSREKTKTSYQKGWKDYLIHEGNDESNKPFKLLTNLFVNEDDAISELESIRVNPNLVSENKLRNDLEFYIPQLCTFLLFGEIKDIEEFFVFLCRVCNASFFFAHRVHWFLSSMINASEDKREDIIQILKMINTLFKSEDVQKKIKIGKFYVSNSEQLVKYIKKHNLYLFYDIKKIQKGLNPLGDIEFNDLNGYQQQIFNKYTDSRNLIIKYSENEYQMAKEKELKKLEQIKNKNNNINLPKNEISTDSETSIHEIKKKFKANDFYIDISNFELENVDYTYEADSDDEFDRNTNISLKETIIVNENNNMFSEKKSKIPLDINFISYHSSLNFIEHLCDISNELPKHPKDEQKLYLFQEISEINKKLPCNVYLPFLKDSTRNYIICHIPLEEVKIFRTKTRCPIMLTFEMIRLDETNINNEEDEEQDPDAENLTHSRSNTIASIRPSLKYEKKVSNKLPPGRNRLEYEYDVDNLNSSYINADFNLSKPLMISVNPAIDKKATIMKKSSKNSTGKLETELSVIPNKDSYEEDEESMDNFNYSNKNSLDEEIKIKEKEHKRLVNIASKFTIRPSGEIRNTVNPNSANLNFGLKAAKTFMFQEKIGTRPSIKDKDDNLNQSVKKETSLDKNIIETNEENENSLNSENKPIDEEEVSYEGEVNQEYFDKIFGETIEEKENKLKKKSIFGKIKTHKIFRCIFKTHEDLRQEQFATQLINEFYQIFKLENTGCWLNTYEIISTGNNSGLVEMVDNSLSLDQLKQKTNHISLKNFYIKFFGKGSEESSAYKKAMDNYVASLAGYSLVCYFLQIKDRHNGNILIDNEGHLIHIDFGFLLSNAPGKGLKFENAPFKLSRDMVDCLGGVDGKYFGEFRKLLKKGFLAVNKHRAKIIILVEMMWCGHGKKLDCFEKGQEAINELKSRLNPKEGGHKIDVIKFVDTLIGQSVHNWRTKWYDIFQYYVQGIFY